MPKSNYDEHPNCWRLRVWCRLLAGENYAQVPTSRIDDSSAGVAMEVSRIKVLGCKPPNGSQFSAQSFNLLLSFGREGNEFKTVDCSNLAPHHRGDFLPST